MVRPALYSDIPRLVELLEEMHARSKYAEYPVSKRKFKDLCMESIRSGNGCLFVSEDKGEIRGFIIGAVDDLYHVLRVKYATDLFFYVSEQGKGAGQLVTQFIDWAIAKPDVVTIRMGATDAITDFNRVAKLYERKGLTQEGVMHEMRIKR